MLTFSLQSGSNGNSIYVEAGGMKLLFDAGISGACAERRMAAHGRDIREVDALIITHDHVDHTRCAGVFHRKFGIPIYITRATQAAMWHTLGKTSPSLKGRGSGGGLPFLSSSLQGRGPEEGCPSPFLSLPDFEPDERTPTDCGEAPGVRYFTSGDVLEFGRVRVHTIRTPHDAADGVAIVIECEDRRLGVLTDLGHPFPGLRDIVESVDAAYLECNYDPDMLERGSYPHHLKARIRGDGGHLSNDESADLLRLCGPRLPDWVAVAHLSQENNLPELAIGAQQHAVGMFYPVYHASRYEVSPVWEV